MVDPSLVEVLPTQLALFPQKEETDWKTNVFHRLHPLLFGLCTLGTTNLTFFRKWRIQTLWWVQNWNLRHIYKIHFWFSEPFLRVWLESFQNVQIWQKKFISSVPDVIEVLLVGPLLAAAVTLNNKCDVISTIFTLKKIPSVMSYNRMTQL